MQNQLLIFPKFRELELKKLNEKEFLYTRASAKQSKKAKNALF